MKKIALVTPLKDELSNIYNLIDAISSQSTPIYAWVIVENGSTDGSKEILAKLSTLKNVEHFFVINFTLPNEKYELGFKYSTVVNEGFKHLSEAIKNQQIESPDYIGICDADCFPKNNYYNELTAFMTTAKLGISSGVGKFQDGSGDGEAHGWVRGNCRLWTWQTFQECGYIIGPSADALSLAKAIIRGYHAKPNHSLVYICREMGQRTRYEYYGYANYYRGITVFYAILKFFNYLRVGQSKQGLGFIKGYLSSRHKKLEQINDLEILTYFKNQLANKLKKIV